MSTIPWTLSGYLPAPTPRYLSWQIRPASSRDNLPQSRPRHYRHHRVSGDPVTDRILLQKGASHGQGDRLLCPSFGRALVRQPSSRTALFATSARTHSTARLTEDDRRLG